MEYARKSKMPITGQLHDCLMNDIFHGTGNLCFFICSRYTGNSEAGTSKPSPLSDTSAQTETDKNK